MLHNTFFSVARKILSLFLVLMLTTWFYIEKPALASNIATNNQNYENLIKNCLFSQPDSGVGEVVCDLAKTIMETATLVGICYTIDGLATSFFPPAAALAPVCNMLGITQTGQKTVVSLTR